MINEGIMTQQEVNEVKQKQFDYYNEELMKVEEYQPEKSYFQKQWNGFSQAPSDLTIWDTGVGWDLLSYIGRNSVYHPNEFVRIKLNSLIPIPTYVSISFSLFIHTLKRLSSTEESRSSLKEMQSIGQQQRHLHLAV